MRVSTGLLGACALVLALVALGAGRPRASESSPAGAERREARSLDARAPAPPLPNAVEPDRRADSVPVVAPEPEPESEAAQDPKPESESKDDPAPAPAGLERAFQLERDAWAQRERELLGRIDDLTVRLEQERSLRDSREREWFDFTRMISALPVPGTPSAPAFLDPEEPADVPGDGEAIAADAVEGESEADTADEQREALSALRAEKLLLDLRALLIAEQVVALDFLAIGRVHDGWTGPIVVRLLDDWNRPMGTLAAERLRLEVSRAGRTVTLVLEEGFESHGGIPVPFGAPTTPGARRGGVRRIDLPGIDPEPWIQAFPELIDPDAEEPVTDDGKWDLAYVRTRLNEFLRTDTTAGLWRLRGLGGVTAGALRDVQLVEYSLEGRVIRRLFADHLRIEKHAEGVMLRLEEGVQERGGRTAPFLEGRYRIYFPRAKAEDWIAARMPGLSEPAGDGMSRR